MCKGALIERMPSATPGTFIWFRCLFCENAWKFFVDDPRENLNGELTGDIVIVTNRRKKYRPASVAVIAIPEVPLRKHLASKTLQLQREGRELQHASAGLAATLKTAEAEEERLWQVLKRDENNSRKAQIWSAAYNKTKNLAKQIQEMQAQTQHLTSGEYYLEGLPSPISTAKTDAGGKFTLTIPRQGRYGVVAQVSRELFKKEERYFWFVWASLDGQASKHLTLSNANMIGAESPDSALK